MEPGGGLGARSWAGASWNTSAQALRLSLRAGVLEVESTRLFWVELCPRKKVLKHTYRLAAPPSLSHNPHSLRLASSNQLPN